MQKLLVTGAAGVLGIAMRSRLSDMADTSFRLTDIVAPSYDYGSDEFVQCDLSDEAAVLDLVEGCDGIVHLGGISVEDEFSKILQSNIVGMYNLYEAARAHGHPRIMFASSNHVIGYYPQGTPLQADCAVKPDGLYGVSKCFGEAIAAMYHAKFGQETAIVRIGSCVEKPTDYRALATWLSYDDLAGLIKAVFAVPVLGCPTIWGVSNNDGAWWDNAASRHLGWTPKDNAEDWRKEVEANCPVPDPEDAIAKWQGGIFTDDPIIKKS
ncbi:MAG: NAD(P)-dependent oxidoreductase [Rhizobiales bacterium]|nr:NAD(P)-dependent oxidoreductase [Hyphomicrobiales bacterium]